MKGLLCLALLTPPACTPLPAEPVQKGPFLEARGVRVDIATQGTPVHLASELLQLESEVSPLVLTGHVTWQRGQDFAARCEQAEIDPRTGTVVLQTQVRASMTLSSRP
ncbi:MAG: hypothetical protein MUC50_02850 [Myxococcota bacterium]|jgi:hypothetical protein|nr:hypothetical protein [Myxococcota bacterium]